MCTLHLGRWPGVFAQVLDGATAAGQTRRPSTIARPDARLPTGRMPATASDETKQRRLDDRGWGAALARERGAGDEEWPSAKTSSGGGPTSFRSPGETSQPQVGGAATPTTGCRTPTSTARLTSTTSSLKPRLNPPAFGGPPGCPPAEASHRGNVGSGSQPVRRAAWSTHSGSDLSASTLHLQLLDQNPCWPVPANLTSGPQAPPPNQPVGQKPSRPAESFSLDRGVEQHCRAAIAPEVPPFSARTPTPVWATATATRSCSPSCAAGSTR